MKKATNRRRRPRRTYAQFFYILLLTMGVAATIITYLATGVFQRHPFLTMK